MLNDGLDEVGAPRLGLRVGNAEARAVSVVEADMADLTSRARAPDRQAPVAALPLASFCAWPCPRTLTDKTMPRKLPKAFTESESIRPMRYLVLGSDGHGRRVEAYRWDRLPADLNVADYDVVILNFAAFEDEALAEGFPVERLPSDNSMARLLFAPKSEIIAIGDPRTEIGPRPTTTREMLLGRRKRADYWLPCWLGVEDDKGSSYEVTADEWQPFYEAVSRWPWIATGEYGENGTSPAAYLAPVMSKANDLRVALNPLALTRFQKPIGLEIQVTAYVTDHTAGVHHPVAHASPVFWLPAPDKLSPPEAIDLILRERYGLASETRLPEWAAGYSLPTEAPVKDEIVRLEDERERLGALAAEARNRAAQAARPRLLLYEKGKDTLEPVVRAALRELGARVEDPQAEGVEDGTLIRTGQAAILEIKGRKGPLKQDDVRQVVQWASDAKLRDGIQYKPLIVGNAYCETPPDERGEALAPNAATYARNGDVAVVTTVQLFEALRQKQLGVLDEDDFWSVIFESKGSADLPVPLAPDVVT